ncbi:hypothetical protein [Xanthomonas theicola]|uniref:Lipase modulator n=1 Tax=Xanthomonas theicola TaxID=56464 RepID=A0A2S6ZD78_9XANT|nr:hypothetical protein [Xanthomonas theicola]PPT90245.1 hypothetical protein XthCFBP4691_13510 [Xanthomonas theicola]QNH25333.1 hypothetical protein G4Q83_12090 [Xanthomonas theicola]
MPSRVPPGTYAIAITVLAVAIASVAAWRERPTDAASRRGLGEAIGDTASAVAARQHAAPAAANAPTAADGAQASSELHFDRQGQLVPDLALRRYLDRHLASRDAQQPAAVRLDRDLAAAMPAAQAQQVLAWFDRYTAYLQAEGERSSHAADPGRQMQHSREMRERLLGAQAAAAFFADEDAAR